jgi:hypothetical protein
MVNAGIGTVAAIGAVGMSVTHYDEGLTRKYTLSYGGQERDRAANQTQSHALRRCLVLSNGCDPNVDQWLDQLVHQRIDWLVHRWVDRLVDQWVN